MKCFIVPDDTELRKNLSAAKVVICSVRLTNGEIVDIADISYKQRPELQELLSQCEEADIDIVEEEPY